MSGNKVAQDITKEYNVGEYYIEDFSSIFTSINYTPILSQWNATITEDMSRTVTLFGFETGGNIG